MSKVYEYISAEVQEYWMLVEDALNDAVRYQSNPDAGMLNAIESARHNLRMIISTVNHEALKRELDSIEI
jgi:hypothetical protein